MPGVFKAISPHYAFQYFYSTGKASWVSLNGILLCVSGSEALFADMGHFSHRAISVSTILENDFTLCEWGCMESSCLSFAAKSLFHQKCATCTAAPWLGALSKAIQAVPGACQFCLDMASKVQAKLYSYYELLRLRTLAVQLTTIFFVYPSLLLIYFGEAAYLATFPADFGQSYYAAIPQPLFWPMFLIATASALVGSQSLISSAFSVARQSAVMSCFPPVRVRPPPGYCLLCGCLSLLSGPVWLLVMMGLAYPGSCVFTVLLVCS